MGKFPEDFLQSLKDRASLVDVISSHTRLKPAGRRHKGLCPFHNEKTPSFTVDTEKGFWKCFGCGKSGDIITFVMEAERLPFPDAVADLARRYSIPMPQMERGEDDRAAANRRKLKETNELAARYFANMLERTEIGRRASEYLDNRRMPAEARRQFRLGVSLDEWEGLTGAFRSKGYDLEPLVQLGLARKKDGRVYDYFRGRLMFALCNANGEVVGFAARALGEEKPKYVNSPQSIIFDKSRLLYGIDHAKRETVDDTLIIVEGYMDVLMMWSVGIRNVVATMGTSLTDSHADMMKRYCKTVILAYDSDVAGNAAAQRGIEMLLERDLKVRTLRLPEGHDPDSYARDFGGEALKQRLDEAIDYFEYTLNQFFNKYDVQTSDGKQDIIKAISPIIDKQTSEVKRDEQYRALAGRLGLDESIVRSMARAGRRPQGRSGEKTIAAADIGRRLRGAEVHERNALLYMLHCPDYAAPLFREIGEGDFQNRTYRALHKYVCDQASDGDEWDAGEFFRKEHPRELASAIGDLCMEEVDFEGRDLDAEIEKCAAALLNSSITRQMTGLRARMQEAEERGDDSVLKPLQDRYKELAEKRNAAREGKLAV